MIILFDDEIKRMEPYTEEFNQEHLLFKVFTNATSLFDFIKVEYNNVDLFIIDIMIFGPDNLEKKYDTKNGLLVGKYVIEEIKLYEHENHIVDKKPIIVLTNVTGSTLSDIEKDQRIYRTFQKLSIVPSELTIIIKEIKKEY